MKILLICEAVFPENKGGIERWFQTLAQNFQSEGNQVTYFNSSNVNAERQGIRYVSGSKDVWTYRDGGVRSKSQAIRFGFSLFKWLRKEKFDLVYCSSVPIFSILGASLTRHRASKLFVEWFEIWSFRYWVRYSGILSGSIGWLIQLLALQLGGQRVVYTKRAEVQVRKLSISRKENVLLLSGLCPVKEPKAMLRNQAQKDDIYFLGRFVSEKQPIFAIHCIEKFIQTGWNGRFWIAGTGPLATELKTVVRSKSLQGNVILLENPTDDEIEKISSNSFVLFHPSRREGYGLASVEAAYRGVPSLLINYPDNATVDLEITPKLVSQTDDIHEIVGLLTFAWKNQDQLRLETLNWAQKACKVKSSTSSYMEILKIAKRSG